MADRHLLVRHVCFRDEKRDVTGISRTTALTVAAGATFDLTDSALVIDYAAASPLLDVQALLTRGYHGGDWIGDGLTSSAAAASIVSAHGTALGYAEAAALHVGTFQGQPVDATSLVVAYTLGGMRISTGPSTSPISRSSRRTSIKSAARSGSTAISTTTGPST